MIVDLSAYPRWFPPSCEAGYGKTLLRRLKKAATWHRLVRPWWRMIAKPPKRASETPSHIQVQGCHLNVGGHLRWAIGLAPDRLTNPEQ